MGQIINDIDTTGLVVPNGAVELILYVWSQITLGHIIYYGIVYYIIYRFTKFIYEKAWVGVSEQWAGKICMVQFRKTVRYKRNKKNRILGIKSEDLVPAGICLALAARAYFDKKIFVFIPIESTTYIFMFVVACIFLALGFCLFELCW